MDGIKKYFKFKISSFKYKYKFLKVLFNTPFKPFKLQWYFGKIKVGTPIFLPRKWVKCNLEDAEKEWERIGEYSRNAYLRNQTKKEWLVKYTKGHTKVVSIKYFGWHFHTLGWKTKWTRHDYRHEWNPGLSIVIFGKQLAIGITFKDSMIDTCYWEAWLNWEYNTDKTKSKEERFKELIKKYSCTWGNDDKGYVDYYKFILNKKYLKLYENL